MVGISELAKKTNTKVTTIRYFETIGLISSPPRTEGNHRQYSQDHIMRLNFINHCRELGFSQNEIRELLGLNDNVNPICLEVNTLTQYHIKSVTQKINKLKRIKKILNSLSATCTDGQSTECPIIDLLYEGTI